MLPSRPGHPAGTAQNRRPAAQRTATPPGPQAAAARGRRARAAMAAGAATGVAGAAAGVDQTLNPRVASLKVSKTMALTDMARSMQEAGVDVSARSRGRASGRAWRGYQPPLPACACPCMLGARGCAATGAASSRPRPALPQRVHIPLQPARAPNVRLCR